MTNNLPSPVENEIFTLSSVVGDVVIDHLCDILEEFGLSISVINNLDTSVIIDLYRSNLFIELRIDRFARKFEAVATIDGYTYLPCRGDWGDIIEYIKRILDSM